MSTWSGMEAICTEFSLTAVPSDASAVEEELLLKVRELHPDKTGGDFPSPTIKAHFLRLNEALEFVRSASQGKQLLVRGDVQLIAQRVADHLARTAQTTKVRMREDIVRSARHRAAERSLLPRIASGTMFGISTLLFTLAGSLKDHPFLSVIEASHGAMVALGLLWVLSSGLFLALRLQERNAARYVEYLLSLDGIRDIFARLQGLLRSTPRPLEFTERDLRDVISRSSGYESVSTVLPILGFLQARRLDNSTLDEIVDSQIKLLLDRRVIRALPDPGLHRWYQIQPKSERAGDKSSE